MPTNKTKVSRLFFIDCMRGFGGIYVAVHHILVMTPNIIAPKWLEPFIGNGYTGVTLFFIVSAFTLSYTLQKQKNTTHYKGKFFFRRIFRIVPLYYFWLMIMIAMWGKMAIIDHKFDLLLYAGFVYNFIPAKQSGLVWASWTLGVEMIFYLLFPFIFYYVNTLKRSVIFLIVSLIISQVFILILPHFFTIFNDETFYTKFVHLSLFFQLPVFAVGMICYFIYEKKINNIEISKSTGKFLLVLGLVGIVIVPYIIPGVILIKEYIMAIFYALLLLGLAIAPIGLLVNRITIFFGMISYSLYLNNPQLISHLSSLYNRIYSIHYSNTASFLACITSTLLLLTPLSYLTYVLIEKPGMSFGKFLIRKIYGADKSL